jgi:hypothetical protein
VEFGLRGAFHLTGLYPDGGSGDGIGTVVGWAGGVTGESLRDTMQRLIMGRPGEWGTGTIPKALIVGDPKRAMGVADLIDTVHVRHVSGGISRLSFKSYEKGRERGRAKRSTSSRSTRNRRLISTSRV